MTEAKDYETWLDRPWHAFGDDFYICACEDGLHMPVQWVTKAAGFGTQGQARDRIIADHAQATAIQDADHALYIAGKMLNSCAAALSPANSENVKAAARKGAMSVHDEIAKAWTDAANRIAKRAALTPAARIYRRS